MPSIIFSLVFVSFLTVVRIESIACASPTDSRILNLDHVLSLRREIPSIIGKIKVIMNQLQCPKGWKHFGGSCYYLSKTTSTPIQANHTCNLLHFDHPNLMQIRSSVELFYAAHILTRNNLSGVMIDIDPDLFKGTNITEMLIDTQARWQRTKDKFSELRVRYYKLKEEVIDELSKAGLGLSTRSRKTKQSVKNRKQKNEHSTTIYNLSNNSTGVDKYEYDNLNSEDQIDEFERMVDIQGICDQIDWNVKYNDSTVYMLTTALISNKMICSLNNVEPDAQYRHVCQYALNFCFANTECGKHGRCVNTFSGFKCSCSFLYSGLLCDRISNQGKQIIVSIIIILVLYGLSLRIVRWALLVAITGCIKFCRGCRKTRQRKKQNGTQKLVHRHRIDENHEKVEEQYSMDQWLPIVPLQKRQFIFPVKHSSKRALIRLVWVGGLSIVFLTLLLSITTIMHITSFKYGIVNETDLHSSIMNTAQLGTKHRSILIYRMKVFVLPSIALVLTFIFSWTIKREKRCLDLCNGRPGLIPPMEPFRTENRFTTASVFGIVAFELLKAVDELLLNTNRLLNDDLLNSLLQIMGCTILIGLQYYPVLVSLQLRHITARFFVCLYILAAMMDTIIREGSCMGFSPLLGSCLHLEQSKLRIELGTQFFIIYSILRSTPQFFLLSYITAELFVRFAYDSIYVPIKKKRSIWAPSVTEPDESALAKSYVTKLFRRSFRYTRAIYSTNTTSVGYEYDAELQTQTKRSCIKKFLDSIYQWDNDFRFTTMVTCAYTVAVVCLYYLACALVVGYISFARYYIETKFHTEFQGFLSLRAIVIISAVIAIGMIALQLYIGLKNYKKHKLQLFKGIYQEIPSAVNFKSSAIVSNSVLYFGFLVGHMACGFIILFHLLICILYGIEIIFLQIPYVQLLLTAIVPVLVLYLLTMIVTTSLSQSFFIEKNLKKRKAYAFFIYFSCFVHCLLGFGSCIIRLIKVTFLNVVSMARLDVCLYGRSFEKFDVGFAAYISYLHMEVAYTNPIMLAFCYSFYDDIVQRRPTDGYDEMNIELKPKIKKTTSRNLNKSLSASSIADENKSINMDENEDEDLSMEKMKSPNSSIISKEPNQKSKRQIANDTQDTPLQAKLKPTNNVPTFYSNIGHLFNPERASEFRKIIKQKQARFRWFLAYTILNNYHLFDLRREVKRRIDLLRDVRRSTMEIDSPESPARRQIQSKTKTSAPEISVSRAVTYDQLFMPDSDVDSCHQSLTEEDTAHRSPSLSRVNAQKVHKPLSTNDNTTNIKKLTFETEV